MNPQELKLKKAHIKLMRHPETCLYGGVILMGESSVETENCPTAYTDGTNKRYGEQFMTNLTDPEVVALVLHENLHVMLKHIPRHKDLIKEDARLANQAMDYVVNDIIVNLEDKSLAKLPKGGLYDPMFHDWSVRQVYDYLKQEQDNGGGSGKQRGDSLDEHDANGVETMTTEQLREMSDKVNEAIQQGAMLAGKFGVKIPRVIKDLMEPKIDWRDALREFVTASTRGVDEYTWARFNRRRLADEYYLPSTINERVGEIVVAIDTSGSINNEQIAEFATELVGICDTVTPERVRVLWWDTEVHGEQIFEGNYSNIASMLKPMGGGGTKVSSVGEYINKNTVSADCVIVFTDGHVEPDIKWDIGSPTLWLITHNRNFKAPVGNVVKMGI